MSSCQGNDRQLPNHHLQSLSIARLPPFQHPAKLGDVEGCMARHADMGHSHTLAILFSRSEVGVDESFSVRYETALCPSPYYGPFYHRHSRPQTAGLTSALLPAFRLVLATVSTESHKQTAPNQELKNDARKFPAQPHCLHHFVGGGGGGGRRGGRSPLLLDSIGANLKAGVGNCRVYKCQQ